MCNFGIRAIARMLFVNLLFLNINFMKNLLIFCCLLLYSFLSVAQINFNENIITNNIINYPWDICIADLNSDNNLDLLIASSIDNKISWLENNGFGNFNQQHIITIEADGAISIAAADLDGDGDMDVVSASANDDKIAWYENDGTGNFGSQQLISTIAADAKSVFCVDIDSDNDIDIVSCSFGNNEVVWYENDGTGNFSSKQIISIAVLYPFFVSAADLDGDDDIDVLSASILDNKIAWYENLGNGNFGPQIIISQQVSQPRTIIISDLNGNGYDDIAIISGNKTEVAWFENDGLGNFGPKQIIENTGTYGSIDVCDINNDGYKDVIAPPKIFLNNGNGQFTSSIVLDNFYGYVSCNDLDSDGDIDLAFTYGFGNLAWYANDGTGNFGNRIQIAYCINLPGKLDYADIDGDNLKDIVVSATDTFLNVCWFKNYGNGDYLLEDTINSGLQQIKDLSVADLDGDSLMDILTLYDSINTINIGWNKQDSTGNFGPIQIVTDSAHGGFTIHLTDIDSDGDKDILFGTSDSNYPSNSKLLLWKNDGFGNFGNKIIIRQGYGPITDIKTFDLDNDGNLDILFTQNMVKWGKNLGGANNFQYFDIGSDSWCSRAVNAADLDGDGDLDVVYSSNSNNPSWGSHISWIRNDGNGSFTSMPLLYPSHTKEIELKDMDKDGDIDIIARQYNEDNSLFWLENDGLGNFVYTPNGATWNIEDSIYVTSIVVDDFDGDGDNDVLYNSKNDGLIAWAENLGYFTSDSASSCANVPYLLSNQVLTSPGIYYDTLQTIYGLDSVIEIDFTHIPIPSVSILPFPQDTFCIQDEIINLPQASPIGGIFAGVGISSTGINLLQTDTGTHEISYNFTDTTTGCSNSDTLQFTVIDCLTIPEAKELGISVYPNPANSFIVVDCQNIQIDGYVKIRIFNVSGKVIKEESPKGFPLTMDIRYLNQGIYYLQLYTGNKTVVYKVVKQ